MNNKSKIIQTAIELFRLFGYDGASIDMLVKTAGVSKSNFYYYFESKEKLGLKVLEILFNHQKDILSILIDRDVNPAERFVKFYVEGIYVKRDLFCNRVLFSQILSRIR